MFDVERARARLGQDLNALQSTVKREFDWLVQYERRPWTFLGAAFVLAALLGLATKGAPRLQAERGARVILWPAATAGSGSRQPGRR
jgi:hypothetical protein